MPVVLIDDFPFVLFDEFGIEVGDAQVLEHLFDMAAAIDPTFTYFVPVAHAHEVETEHLAFVFVVYDPDAFSPAGMFPVQLRVVIGRFGGYFAVHLVFDIQEFGRVEPDAGIVGHRLVAKVVSRHLAHHAASVPDGFHRPAARAGLAHLGAIARRVNVGDVGFQIVIDEDALLGFQGGIFEEIDIGVHAGGEAYVAALDAFPLIGDDCGGPALAVIDNLPELSAQAQVEMVFPDVAETISDSSAGKTLFQ